MSKKHFCQAKGEIGEIVPYSREECPYCQILSTRLTKEKERPFDLSKNTSKT